MDLCPEMDVVFSDVDAITENWIIKSLQTMNFKWYRIKVSWQI